ncbi:thiol-disulfide oxidoreductase DCC family protein [Aquibaculum arenosum]|uniref:DCC1-like thiol-disulfide oxidoreductase family protein n=1 Tax=Aquibaculum arenosum TaxID=3032591 RepID=A0ABT5YJU4_9PROT|nr:DCC1-like thiol-disulfide oxidoreductase family protein [Fodinicurvata sp. CAU 1616]MDF2095211.1 DCC1-like thiol-disulfide oxidoreductase family protein [Fodinicurvata sp. CAU 1616]
MTEPPRLTIFYDGTCALCRRQKAFWERHTAAGRVAWHDIGRDARPLLGSGISHRRALHRLHARTADRETLTGGRVVVALLREVPGFRRPAALLAHPPLLWLVEGFYCLLLPLRRLVTGRRCPGCARED